MWSSMWWKHQKFLWLCQIFEIIGTISLYKVVGWWVVGVLSNYKVGSIIKIYLESKKNLVNVLLEKKVTVIEFLLFITKMQNVVAKIRIFCIKIIEHTCKFLTTKQLMVYQTINNEIIWSNKSVILWLPNPNIKCFDVIISLLLNPCTKSAAIWFHYFCYIFSHLESFTSTLFFWF